MSETSPEVVILVKTWQGPNKEIARNRLASAKRMFASVDTFLQYPSYSWHVADDGSEEWYQKEFMALVGKRPHTFSNSGANGNIGRNLNVAIRQVLKKTDYILHWSDDIVPERPLNIDPYVHLLSGHKDIGYVRLRPNHPGLKLVPIERDGRRWHLVETASDDRFLVVTSLNLMHRRAWDFYGPYPEGLRIDIMQEEMKWRYRRFTPGLKIVIPDELLRVTDALCVGQTTWEWRMSDPKEKTAWHRFRSYNARFEHD